MPYSIKITALTAIVLIVQLSVMDVYNYNLVHDNLVALLVVAVAFKVGPVRGATFGFVAGLIYGLFSTTIYGTSSLEFVLLGFVAGRSSNLNIFDNFLVKSVFAGILTSIAAVFVVIFLKLLDQATDIDSATVNLLLVNFVANTLLYLPMEKLTGGFVANSNDATQSVL